MASGCSAVAVIRETTATGPVATVFLEFRQGGSGGPDGFWRINCFDGVSIEDLDAATGPEFVRGDCDSGASVDITDAIFLLNHLFQGTATPSCAKACDVNDDAGMNISDAVFLLNWLFGGGSPPAEPRDGCGSDPTPDELECVEAAC